MANKSTGENAQTSQPTLQESAPAAAASPAPAVAADPSIADLKSIVVAQSKQVSDLIGLLTAQAIAASKQQAPAPAPAPVQQAPAQPAQPQIPTVMMPTRRDTYERDRKRVDAWTAEHDARVANADLALREGSHLFEVCIRGGANETDKVTCPIRLVGANSALDAQQKYMVHFGITGVTFPSQFFIKQVQPAGIMNMLSQPVAVGG